MKANSTHRRRRRLAPVAILLATIPALNIIFDTFTGGLGVEPVETLVRRTGWWALTLLVLTLAVTPVRRATGWNTLIEVRKPLGLASFFYACVHFTVYIVLEQSVVLAYVVEDIVERPFITAGFTAFLMLLALAATSTRNAVRRMGGRRWQRLHRLIYPASLLAVLHYFWLVKADVRPPLVYAAIVISLLLLRVYNPFGRKSSHAASRTGASDAMPSRPAELTR